MNKPINFTASKSSGASLCVLSVGQCSYDQPRITALINNHLNVPVDEVSSSRDAFQALENKSYALVLINRVLDSTGESGHELIENIKRKNGSVKVMLVSNFPEAHTQAVSLGALPGFGKDRLQDPSTVACIKAALGLQ